MISAKFSLILVWLAHLKLTNEQTYTAIECPFPEGQAVLSEPECDKYSACEWNGALCYMKSNDVAGYATISDPAFTPNEYQIEIQKVNSSATLFSQDINRLLVEFINHESYHLQIKISDPTSPRYEVPLPLNLSTEPTGGELYVFNTSQTGQLFFVNVYRASTGTKILGTVGPLTYEDQFLQITFVLPSTDLYGFGENGHTSFRHSFSPRATNPIFARGTSVTPGPINLYGHHPYYMVMEDEAGNSHSVFLCNSNAMEYSTFLLDDGTPALTLRTIGGIFDIHIFMGPQPEDLNRQYTQMIGLPALPPYWYLGFTLSKYGYRNTDHVREVRNRTRSAGIPQDVQTFDIDYMMNWRDFTINSDDWNDLPTLVHDLHEESIYTTIILDPAVAIDWDNYSPVYNGRERDVFIKWMSSDLVPPDQSPGSEDYIIGYVWPNNKTAFPDFFNPETQAWWADEIKTFKKDLDFDTLWIDMNEPSNFGTNRRRPWNYPLELPPWSLKCPLNQYDHPPYPTMMTWVTTGTGNISDATICMSSIQSDGNSTFLHYDVHSMYGWSHSRATYRALESLFPDKRPAVLCRSTFPGSGSYTFHWLGDNYSTWQSMKMSIIGMLEFNMFGIPLVGADICGFIAIPSEELCGRWMQLGAFYPFSRNHNSFGMPDQDPGVWDSVANISRDALLLRYKYLPFLYSLFYKTHYEGGSVIRPVLNVFPTDMAARTVQDQFFWGDALMVAPVLEKGAVNRTVYFPEGKWYDIRNGYMIATGPTTIVVDAPFETIPVFIRGGFILPFQEPNVTTTTSRENPVGFTVALNELSSAIGDVIWDDGISVDAPTFKASLAYAANEFVLTTLQEHSAANGVIVGEVHLYGIQYLPTRVLINEVPASAWTYNESCEVLIVRPQLPLNQNLVIKVFPY